VAGQQYKKTAVSSADKALLENGQTSVILIDPFKTEVTNAVEWCIIHAESAALVGSMEQQGDEIMNSRW
jgi:hypothetical protein